MTTEIGNPCKEALSRLTNMNCEPNKPCQVRLDSFQIFDNPEETSSFRLQKNSNGVSKEPNVPKPYFCRFCTPVKEYKSRPGIRKHIQRHHKNVDLISLDWHTLRRHGSAATNQQNVMKRAFTIKPPKLKVQENSILGSEAPELEDPTELDDYFAMKFNPELSMTYLYTPKSTESLKKASQARLTGGTFRCLKCSDLSPSLKSESEFIEHVQEHVLEHDDPYSPEEFVHDGFWCPECGIMFTTKPTLAKHVRCAHEFIENPEDYVNQIGYGKRRLLKNQCIVCRARCVDEIAHESHIRTHGMAYLRLRLQRKSDNLTQVQNRCNLI